MFVVKKRIEWIDALRGFTILLVLLGHNNPPFIKYIYGFHMPLFFIISGYLYHDYRVADHIWKIVKHYYIEYFALCIFNGILYELIVMSITKSGFMNWMAIVDNIKGILLVDAVDMDGCYPLWFLPILAFSEIIFVLIMQVRNKYVKVCLVIGVSAIGFAYSNIMITVPFRLQTAFVGVLFLGIGYYLKHLNVFERDYSGYAKMVQYVVAVICTVGGFLAVSYNTIGGRADMSSAFYGNIPLFLIGAISWSYCMMLLFAKISDIRKSSGVLKVLKYIGERTIFIMSFDEMTNIIGGMILDDSKTAHIWYVDFLTRMAVMSVCFVIYVMICKIYNLILNKISMNKI